MVPHMFLYYFDADISVDGETPPPQPSPKQQEDLNTAVRMGGRKNTAPRSSLNIFSPTTAPTEDGAEKEKFINSQPAGIIDLECYTNMHRSAQDPPILELAGDDSVNPDLRSFYFCASSPDGADEWTQALLNSRHGALIDEKEAYRQVCDGFAQQLQHLHQKYDTMEKNKSDAEEECYRVRSQQEEVRRAALKLIQETLERDASSEHPLAQARRAYRTDLETVRHQDMGVTPAIQLLCDYTAVLEVACSDLSQKVDQTKEQLRRSHDGDSQQAQQLEQLLETKERTWSEEKERLEMQVKGLQHKLLQSQKSLKDTQQDLVTQKMEFTMYQSSSKNKIQELGGHKKILKREVIDLRRKLDNVGSELSMLKHHSKSSKMEVEQERRKSELLERYVEKMESQVKVQQNMMEMMSQGYDSASRTSFSPSRSRNGGSRGSQQPYRRESYTSPRHQDIVVVNTPSMMDDEDAAPPREDDHSQLLRKAMEDDNKSHLSELTEDRTQRHIDVVAGGGGFNADGESPSMKRSYKRPPSFIGVSSEAAHPKLDTITSSASSFRSHRRTPPTDEPSTTTSLGSIGQKRLSVAQRARLEAERSSGTPVRVRAPAPTPTPPLLTQRPTNSTPSFLSNVARSITDAIDNSVLGVADPSSSENDENGSTPDAGSMSSGEEHEQTMSETGSTLSLHERGHMQRTQQIAFLKEQGLLKSGNGLKAGAGATSPLAREDSRY